MIEKTKKSAKQIRKEKAALIEQLLIEGIDEKDANIKAARIMNIKYGFDWWIDNDILNG